MNEIIGFDFHFLFTSNAFLGVAFQIAEHFRRKIIGSAPNLGTANHIVEYLTHSSF